MTINNRRSVYIIAVALAACTVPGTGNVAFAQVKLPGQVDDLTRLPDLGLERRIEERVEEVEETADDVTETAEDTVDETVGVVEEVVDAAGNVVRRFVGGVDPNGWDIEEEIIVVMVESDDVDALIQTATEVISRRDLPALGQSLLILRRTINLPMQDAIDILRNTNPDALVDYNHIYRPTSDEEDVAAAPTGPAENSQPATDSTLRIGIVDSAVMHEHRALQHVNISDRDFASNDGLRPLTHGTAVASLVARSSNDSASIYAASVFFQVPNHSPGATAESLVAALDWLVSEDVDVINMSLAGPGNQILEAAIAAVIGKGKAVVAAVGNNGPKGDPLYPAAYDGVIGVTAVDNKNRIFRYANQGEHVDYAAPGVNLRVADSATGGWRIESGTSMASPHVAVIIAQTLKSSAVDSNALMSWLMASAEDLGRKGFDKVFGYGLITRPPAVASTN